MEIKRLNDGQELLVTNHGDEVLYSEGKPIAGYKWGIGFFKERNCGKIEYLEGVDDVLLMSSEEIEGLFLGVL